MYRFCVTFERECCIFVKESGKNRKNHAYRVAILFIDCLFIGKPTHQKQKVKQKYEYVRSKYTMQKVVNNK